MQPTNRLLTMPSLVLLGTLAIACGDGADTDDAGGAEHFVNPYEGYRSATYDDDSMWLCRPGLPHDYCFDDQDSSEFLADGSQRAVPHEAAAETDFDCFYIYPTVDFGEVGNVTDLEDVSLMLDPLMNQAAPFNSLCTVYAPLYHQITIQTYASGDPNPYLDIAYLDVEDAFRHYMGQHNQGRPVVIMGHSQGTHMTRRLLQGEFDEVPAMRERLIAGLLIGGDVRVPAGETVGGSFQNIPLCTGADELGCVIAYRSFSEEYPPSDPAGVSDDNADASDLACVNPADLAGNRALLAGAYFPIHANQKLYGSFMEKALEEAGVKVTSPRILYRDFFSAECVTPPGGDSYLEISVTPRDGDQRANLVPFDNAFLNGEVLGLGLHILDYNFPMTELLTLVESKAARMAEK